MLRALENGMDTEDMPPGFQSTRGHARYIANPEVWIEGEAVRQLEVTAADSDCVCAVGMPDLHPGPGYPIGAAFGNGETVRPHLVGSDAGCGALFVALGKVKFGTSTERRLRAEFEVGTDALADVDREAVARDAWREGPKALLRHDLPDVVHALADRLPFDTLCSSGESPTEGFGSALATIGGGNHFAEIAKVVAMTDTERASALGLRSGGLVLLCHSGSRGIGKLIAERWQRRSLRGCEIEEYLQDLAGAVRFASTNRLLLAWRLLRALGVTRASKVSGLFDVVHNDVRRESWGTEQLWVHRKGCAPAHEGQNTIVLGSRGAPSWILEGKGNERGLSSVAHGAGRKMQRSEARDKLRSRYKKTQLAKAALGGTVICDDAKLLYEEHPDVYKAIEPVVASLEEAGMATRVASVLALLTVKK